MFRHPYVPTSICSDDCLLIYMHRVRVGSMKSALRVLKHRCVGRKHSCAGLILHGGIASMPPGHCLGAREMLHSRKLQLPHRVVSFTKEEMYWCPCPFKDEAYRLSCVTVLFWT